MTKGRFISYEQLKLWSRLFPVILLRLFQLPFSRHAWYPKVRLQIMFLIFTNILWQKGKINFWRVKQLTLIMDIQKRVFFIIVIIIIIKILPKFSFIFISALESKEDQRGKFYLLIQCFTSGPIYAGYILETRGVRALFF